MPSKGNKQAESTRGKSVGGPLQRAAAAIGRLLHRGKSKVDETVASIAAEPSRPVDKAGGQRAAKTVTRQSDIGIDVLNRTYTPPLTSNKAGFRSDGADHQRDQEFAAGSSDERWADEDRFTNKSGDPRIGTHNRTYEPGESRDDARRH